MTRHRIFAIVLLAALAFCGEGLAQQQAQDNPGELAFRAQKAVEIGEFYLKKGDVDAAIDRFKEAIEWKANLARPRLLLGKAYEKKGEKAEAVKYYKEYLEILPKAVDAARVRKQIEKLTRELEKESSKKPRRPSKSLEEFLGALEHGESLLFAAEFG
jgi:Tfp pilus assembly protein PilF